MENSPTGTIVVAMDSDDGEEPVLIMDKFKIARNNFLIGKPVEASYPSTIAIKIEWPSISETNSAAEEKIIYYSLEWD